MKDIIAKTANLVKQHGNDLFMLLCVLFIALISYNLGKAHAFKKTPINITENASIFQALSSQSDNKTTIFQAGANADAAARPLDTRVVVSKNSDKYHFTWCGGAKQIKPENQIWFDNETMARNAGYTLAGNCQ
ncbi:MAG: hypothetical protein Q8P35_03020 [Candidatus Yanofskybacteria bacterium]|nr:hypothetical protein [Candidatus Yanofskybacteria bacterium]